MTAELVNGSAESLLHSKGLLDSHYENVVGGIHSQKSKESDRRRLCRKQKKVNKTSQVAANNVAGVSADDESEDANGLKENTDPQQVVNTQVEVEYVPEKAEIEDDLHEDFKKVFEKFTSNDVGAGAEDNDKNDETAGNATSDKKGASDSDEEEQDTQQKERGLSNKKKKLQRRMKIAELKQICQRPDVVEIWDVTALDPKLLVYLKSYRDTVPVPRHWSQKRKFLQGKRGIEKQPFQLPDFIAATGIEKLRQAYIDKEDSKKLKQKQRERMQPKMGKMDTDY